MKNIHVLPTDKPSEFYSIDGKHKLANNTMAMDWYISSVGYKPHNIYITDDSEIKEGDWILDTVNDIIEKVKFISKGKLINGCWVLKSCKKIILTTDQDLIKDGVQAINDEFLEWFVKNPSCEEVEVESNKCLVKRGQCSCSYQDIDCQCSGYKIVIPKEEPKQETLEEVLGSSMCQFSVIENKLAILYRNQVKIYDVITKEQDKNKYSEEEVLVKLYECLGHFACQHNIVINGNEIDKWFEQFKKK